MRKRIQSSWKLRPGERRFLIILGDLVFAWVAFSIAVYVWANAQVQPQMMMDFINSRLQGWFYWLPVFWIVLLVDSYDGRTTSDSRRTIRSISAAALIGAVIYLVVYFASDQSLPRRGVAAFLASAVLLTLIWRLFYIWVFTGARFVHNVLVVGAGESGKAIVQVVNLTNPPYKIIGLVDDDPEKQGMVIEGKKVLGTSAQLLVLAETNDVTEIIVAITGRMLPTTFQILLEAQEQGIEITRMPVAYEELLERVPVEYLEADWILRSFVDESRVSAFYALSSRLLDILGGAVGIVMMALVYPVIAIGILLETGRPIVFSQVRAGKGGIPFTILKFRSMYVIEENGGISSMTQESDQRVTPFGRLLRKSHLDETLQFMNVLRGEMSLVGPRPELPRLVDHFQQHIPFYRARLLAKPGITGWAQNHLSYASNIEETKVKLEYDLYYIKHRSLLMDIGILLRTVASVLGFRGR